jgi:hypothetical protein
MDGHDHRRTNGSCWCVRRANGPATRRLWLPFFSLCDTLAGTGSAAMGFDMGGIERGTIPVNQAGGIGLCLQYLEQALPGAIARPAHETVVTGLPRP